MGPAADPDGVRDWYNGYRMGDTVVYNPWSVLRYLSNPAEGFVPYWVNTASHDLLRGLVVEGGMGLHDDLALLMRGGEIEAQISEDIHLRDLPRSVATVWSFLLFAGYLKASATEATHIVDSNRESGFGRSDVCVRPRMPGRPGAALELKGYDPDRWISPEKALDAAMAQLRDRAYATSLRQAGAYPIWQWAAVFDGKRVHVRNVLE